MREERKLELVNLLDPRLNKIYGPGQGESARAGISYSLTRPTDFFWAERTIGVPARFAVQEFAPGHFRFIVAHRIDEIRAAWHQDVPAGTWIKPFDVSYTQMWPAHHRVEIKIPTLRERQYEWQLKMPLYQSAPELDPDTETVGTRYVSAIRQAVRDQLRLIPDDAPISVSLSGGTDSNVVLAVLLDVMQALQRINPVHCLTLTIDGGGSDLAQAQQVAAALRPRFGTLFTHHVINVDSSTIDRNELRRRAAAVTEDHRILDLESAMACLLLFGAAERETEAGRLPVIRYEFNGDGGNEVFCDYPLTGRGFRPIPLEEVWQNPQLFLFGHGPDRLTNPIYSAGLSRGYTRTFNPARHHHVTSFSPLIDRRVIEISGRIPLRTLAPTEDDLHRLRGLAVQAGVRCFMGIDLPVFPKTMFQDGASAKPNLIRVSEEESHALKAEILRGSLP